MQKLLAICFLITMVVSPVQPGSSALQAVEPVEMAMSEMADCHEEMARETLPCDQCSDACPMMSGAASSILPTLVSAPSYPVTTDIGARYAGDLAPVFDPTLPERPPAA